MTDALTTACLESMECPVCLNIYSDPKQLSCGHTLCAGCVTQLAQGSQTRNVDGDAAAQHVILCPECRDPTSVPSSGLKTNYRMLGTTCEKRCAAGEFFTCKTCEDSFQTQVLICAVCALKQHKGHNVADLATKEDRDAAIAAIKVFATKVKDDGRQMIFHFEHSFNMSETILDDFEASFEQYCATKSISKDELKAALEKAETLRERYAKATEAGIKANKDADEVLNSCLTIMCEWDVEAKENCPPPFSIRGDATRNQPDQHTLDGQKMLDRANFNLARGGRGAGFAGRGASFAARDTAEQGVNGALNRHCFTCGSIDHPARACPDVTRGGPRNGGRGRGNFGNRQGPPTNGPPPALNGYRRRGDHARIGSGGTEPLRGGRNMLNHNFDQPTQDAPAASARIDAWGFDW